MKQTTGVLALIAFLCVASISSIVPAQAATPVNGIISEDTTWTKNNSPYTLTGPVLVDEGATLTIEPGVTVNIDEFSLRIEGTLRALGSDSEKITINSDKKVDNLKFTQYSQDWNENTQTGSIIENAILNNIELDINHTSPKIINNQLTGYIRGNYISSTISNNNITSPYNGIYIFSSSCAISDNSIHISDATATGINAQNDSSTISGNLIIGTSTDNELTGIRCIGSIVSENIIIGCSVGISTGHSSTIEKNLIINNTEGILLWGYWCTVEHNTISNNEIGIYTYENPNFNYNNLFGNSKYSLQLDEDNEGDINASYNWWGTTNTASINHLIYDSKNNYNVGTVNFLPVLTEADSQAPKLTDEILSRIAVIPQEASSTNNPTASSGPFPENQHVTVFGLDLGDVVIICVLAVIAILLVFVVFYVRKNRANTPLKSK